MDPKLKEDILELCSKVKEVLNNNDWPTEEGRMSGLYGEEPSCPINELVINIEQGVASL